MRSSFKVLLPLVGLSALLWVGCTTAYPTSYLSSSGPSAGMVVDFEGVTQTSVYATLAEANSPGNVVRIPGVVTYVNPTAGYGTGSGAVVGSAANGTSFCYHVSGAVTDLGDAKYPSIQLQIPLEKSAAVSAYYDAQLFTGVKFYIKVMGTDTAGKKTFSIPVAQTQPPSAGGTCNQSAASNACYNDFALPYGSTGGNWQLMTCPFSSFTRGNYGAAISPTTLSGLNLQQILMLDWTEGNSNVAGPANIDFYVDQVEFF